MLRALLIQYHQSITIVQHNIALIATVFNIYRVIDLVMQLIGYNTSRGVANGAYELLIE